MLAGQAQNQEETRLNYWLKEASSLADQLVAMRRQIHQHPETGYQEQATARFLADTMRQAGVDVQEGVGQTGLMAVIKGTRPGRVVALRADMDALPIEETTGLPFASLTPGVSHACGHDSHSAMLAGVAILLQHNRDRFAGTAKLLFQPAEECPPMGGAKPMIADGVLQNPQVDAIYALHTMGDLPVGQISIARGPMMAASDRAEIRIIGKGGHGAAPHQTVDAVLTAAHVVVALQSIVSRNRDPLKPAVLTVGEMHSGYRFNVVADVATLDCTIRTLDPDIRQLMRTKIEQVVAGVTSAMGASYELVYTQGYPSVPNSSTKVDQVIEAAQAVLGDNGLVMLEVPSMGGEDFSYFLQQVPGALFWLGSRLDDGREQHPAHHPGFDLNEKALPLGVSMLCQLVEQELSGK